MNSKGKLPKQIAILLSAVLIVSTLSSCSLGKASTDTGTATGGSVKSSTSTTSDKSGKTTANAAQNISVEYSSKDLDDTWNSSSSTSIKLNGSSIALSGSGASVSGSKATITKSGTYCISGSLSDGQIIVDTQDTDVVKLVLNGAAINCSTSSPVYVKNAKKVVIVLADDTENKVTDGSSYKNVDSTTKEPNAAIFSKADLTFNGSGSLTINANYSHGINSKDKLKIVSGIITVDAVGDGIKGKDMVAVKDGTITVKAKGDGIQSSNAEDAAKGFVCIDGGKINITVDLDGMQAETCVAVHGGNISIVAGGGSANGKSHNDGNGPGMGGGNNPGWSSGNNDTSSDTSSSATSTKGIKAAAGITVTGGTITVDSADDSLHSSGTITINNGNTDLSSGSKAIHADNNVTVNKGDINIKKCYEGIESTKIDVNGGNIRIVSSDDSFNVSDGVSNSQAVLNNGSLDIKGGYIIVDAGGDGLDSNGSITMTAGTVIVSGPTENNNGAVDYNGSFKMTGGLLVAAGSSGMAEAPDTTSTQYVLLANFTAVQQAGTLVNIATDQGKEILTFAPSKDYQSIVLCSPEVKKGSTYVVSTGGSSTGKATDGLYSGGIYKGGTQVASLKVSSIVTQYGSSGRGGMGGHDGQGGGRGGPGGGFGGNPGGGFGGNPGGGKN